MSPLLFAYEAFPRFLEGAGVGNVQLWGEILVSGALTMGKIMMSV